MRSKYIMSTLYHNQYTYIYIQSARWGEKHYIYGELRGSNSELVSNGVRPSA